MNAFNTADGVSKWPKMRVGNVIEIDTPMSVCIKMLANAVKSNGVENKNAKRRKVRGGKVSATENMDTPDDVYIHKCRKTLQSARLMGGEHGNIQKFLEKSLKNPLIFFLM